jgi:sulfatase modifying factor 1
MKTRVCARNLSSSLLLAFIICLLLVPAATLGQRGAPTAPAASAAGFEPEMVPIKGGLFMMGSEKGAKPEQPVHAVVVSNFEIGKYEVTNDQFAAFVDETHYITQAERIGTGVIQKDGGFGYQPGYNWREWNGPGSNLEGRGKHPVVQVSWDDAVAYTQWLSKKTGRTYRLPTEAEWEYTCRGGTKTEYWWGDTFDQTKLNNAARWIPEGTQGFPKGDMRHTLTMEVGSLPANPFGVYEILGNVWEWVADVADTGYYQQLAQGPTSPVVDPKGPDKFPFRVQRKGGQDGLPEAHVTEPLRVIKGGGWNTGAAGIRCASRYVTDPPVYRSDHVGLRVVRNAAR